MKWQHPLSDLDADIRDHIERETQENIDRGMAPEEARYAALRKFGNVRLVHEDTRAVWIPIWVDQLLQDARYALRMIHRSPAFSIVIVLTLALGIGMNTAVFSVFNAVLLRPLSYANPERLVWISLNSEIPSGAIPATEFVGWREQATSFERMVAYENTQDHTIQTADAGTQARNAWVSDEFWALVGTRAGLGCLPNSGEGDVIVLSHGFFERWFQSDRAAVGRAVTLNGRQVTVIGVLPADFRFQFPQEALGPRLDRKDIDIYRQYGAFQPQERGRGVLFRVVAKLKPKRHHRSCACGIGDDPKASSTGEPTAVSGSSLAKRSAVGGQTRR